MIIILTFTVELSCKARDTLLVMFWNMENFFDYNDGGNGDADTEFSSRGSRHWTKRRFYAKCDAVAKSILWIGENYGRMPDIIGFAEIENRGVLEKLNRYTLLRKYDYGIIHYESQDRRGIDVAIMYRKDLMHPESVSVVNVGSSAGKIPTRDILHSKMHLSDDRMIDFIVNHHPSKYGDSRQSMKNRNLAMKTLKSLCDSLGYDKVIAMGDFNDTPHGDSFRILEDLLVNEGMHLFEKGEGSIRYEGRWELIDTFLVSPCLSSYANMEICRIPFLMIWDGKHPGEKPYRTYSGPKYIGGVSDHCPIILKLIL